MTTESFAGDEGKLVGAKKMYVVPPDTIKQLEQDRNKLMELKRNPAVANFLANRQQMHSVLKDGNLSDAEKLNLSEEVRHNLLGSMDGWAKQFMEALLKKSDSKEKTEEELEKKGREQKFGSGAGACQCGINVPKDFVDDFVNFDDLEGASAFPTAGGGGSSGNSVESDEIFMNKYGNVLSQFNSPKSRSTVEKILRAMSGDRNIQVDPVSYNVKIKGERLPANLTDILQEILRPVHLFGGGFTTAKGLSTDKQLSKAMKMFLMELAANSTLGYRSIPNQDLQIMFRKYRENPPSVSSATAAGDYGGKPQLSGGGGGGSSNYSVLQENRKDTVNFQLSKNYVDVLRDNVYKRRRLC